MQSLHMTQQSFAQFLNVAPATLSSIFNDRTRPTLGIVEAIKSKIPNISTDWLMFGNGEMYLNAPASPSSEPAPATPSVKGGELLFDDYPPADADSPRAERPRMPAKNQVPFEDKLKEKILYKKPRQITEIRIFYDDQTWETFVPKK